MSASRCSLVLTLMSVAGSLACGVLRPHPRWSKSTSVAVRVEHPAGAGRASRTGTAVHHQRRFPVRGTAGLPVDLVAVADIEHAELVWLDRRERLSHIEPGPPRRRARAAHAGSTLVTGGGYQSIIRGLVGNTVHARPEI